MEVFNRLGLFLLSNKSLFLLLYLDFIFFHHTSLSGFCLHLRVLNLLLSDEINIQLHTRLDHISKYFWNVFLQVLLNHTSKLVELLILICLCFEVLYRRVNKTLLFFDWSYFKLEMYSLWRIWDRLCLWHRYSLFELFIHQSSFFEIYRLSDWYLLMIFNGCWCFFLSAACFRLLLESLRCFVIELVHQKR